MFLIATLIAVSGEKPFRTSLETALKLFAAHQFPEPSAREAGRIATHLAEAGRRHVTDRLPGFNPVSGK